MATQCSTTAGGRGGTGGENLPAAPCRVSDASPPDRLVPLLALACGSSVATVYFAQPLLVTLGERFALGPGMLGAMVTVTQLGYAAGLLLLVPLGDLVDRRRLVTGQLGLLALALLAAGLAPGAAALLGALAGVGLLAVVAQTMVAAAAALTPPARRGRAVGTVTGGIVTGILLARAAAGALADLAGWRAVYLASAGVTVVLAVLVRRVLPPGTAAAGTPGMSYGWLVASTVTLFVRHPLLRIRGALALLVFAAFSTLWSAVAQPLSGPPWSLSHTAIGAFGLAGAAGAVAARAAGRWNDRGLAQRTTGVGLALLALSWLPIGLTGRSLWALAVGAVLLDFAVQAVHVTNQTLIHAVRPDAGSRIIGGYMVFYSAGSGLGALGASLAYATAGWPAVTVLGTSFSLAALLLWAATRRTRPAGDGPGPL
ncbi:major facilitator transporter [Streptomyces lincolnensis]|uniref:Major facilitator transporter n=1 Tax=Streptomyces lincolnensis TaxID=1915 RepID=A0A1B1M376_STRLN|nr:MFS transporter [Streptomyces lincolnensis]ANS63090.1 major facilitator transporter [Streptomyces lincolnensis]AXG52014.1 major facilitator transporter [Streptomyces lincolnensis]QMV05002.1 MFS transporter [Streptomyces lincolnensis]